MTLLRDVARCRRRMVLVEFVRAAALALPVAVVAALIAIVTLSSTRAHTGLILVAAPVAALSVSAVLALLGKPSLRSVAAAMDRRLDLQDRIVTAMQVQRDDDAISVLVVRDAARRATSVRPADVFPFAAPRFFAPVVASAAAVSLLAIAVTIASRLDSQTRTTTGSGGATGGSAMRAARAGRREAPGSAAVVAATMPAETRPDREPSNSPSESASAAKPKPGEASPAARRTSDANGADSNTAATSESNALPRGALGRAAEGDGRRGAAAAENRGEQAGGVSGLVRFDRTQRSPASRPSTGDLRYDDRYKAAASRAEAAIAREQVPARLRTLVQRYFVAIHP